MINNLGKNGCLSNLIASNDEQIWGAKVFLGKTRNIMDRPLNRLYPMETSFQFFWRTTDQAVPKKMKQTLDQKEMLQD